MAAAAAAESKPSPPPAISSARPWMTASCDVKLFVAATPISGPQFMPITTDDSCASDEAVRLTIETTLAPARRAASAASITSALSPLCESATRTDSPGTGSGQCGISLDMTGSARSPALFESTWRATRAAL